MVNQRLYAVPKPEFVEAPSSWLRRVAARQAVSIRQTGRFLGFRMSRDCDEQIVTMDASHLAGVTGLAEDVFEDVRRMLTLALSLRMKTPVLLREKGMPRYRFCVECLAGMRTPYIPVFWRMDAYRLCTVHQCLLEDHCPHCGAMVCPQSDFGMNGSMRSDVSMLSQCMACSKFLWDVLALKIKAISRKLLSKEDRNRLMNGRVFVAALFHGQAQYPGQEFIDAREAAERAERLGLFASGSHLAAGYFRDRSLVTPARSKSLVPQRG